MEIDYDDEDDCDFYPDEDDEDDELIDYEDPLLLSLSPCDYFSFKSTNSLSFKSINDRCFFYGSVGER